MSAMNEPVKRCSAIRATVISVTGYPRRPRGLALSAPARQSRGCFPQVDRTRSQRLGAASTVRHARQHFAPPRISSRFVQVWRRNFLVWRKLAITSMLGNLADPMLYMLGLGYGLGALLPRSRRHALHHLPRGGHGVLQHHEQRYVRGAVLGVLAHARAEDLGRDPERAHEPGRHRPGGSACGPRARACCPACAILVIIWALGLSHSPLTLWIIPLTVLIGLTFGSLGLVMTALGAEL